MAYDNGSNTWPTGATAIGKTYGPRFTGDINGVTKTEGIYNEVTFEVSAETTDQPYEVTVLGSYIVDQLTLNVSEAFAASSTANISIDGGNGLTTALPLATAAITSPVLTGATKTSGTGPIKIVLTPNANAKASATGRATLVVRYRRVV